MNEQHNYRYKLTKDFSGHPLTLTLIKIKEFKDKNYDLYNVCKVVNKKPIPLYQETFTFDQVERFYKKSTYYWADNLEPEEGWMKN